jgi:hypothetical protein
MIFLLVGFVIVGLIGYEISYRRINGHLSCKQCPHCTDVIPYDATVCATCHENQPVMPSTQGTEDRQSRLIAGELYLSPTF